MKFNFKTYLSNPITLLKTYWDFRDNPYKSTTLIEADTLFKLKELCLYCNEHVPYYKELFASINFKPADMKTLNDFSQIPIMDKAVVREHFFDLQSDEISSMNTVLCSTSGSTGTPLKIYLDAHVNRAIFCKLWRLWNQAPDWHIGKTLLTIDGDNTELAQKPWFFNPKNRFLYFTPFFIKKDNIKMYYDLVKKYKPKILKGYPSAIYTFGKYLEAEGLNLSFSTIFTHSENLLDFQRRFFKSFFGADVVIQYGNNEKAGLIYGCCKGNLHSQDDYAYHEIVDKNGISTPYGIEGRLVCTNLYNYCMPLLRYDTRDLASFSKIKCDCGSNFKVIESLAGRDSDVILTKDNRVVSVIDSAFWNCDNIEMANIHQPKRGEIIVSLVPSPKYTQHDENNLLLGLKERCGEDMHIEIRHVEETEIPRTPVGKVRFITTDLKET